MKFIFIRHGEIDSNTRHIYSGRSQESLNDSGVAQAIRVARSLKNQGITHLYCGPLPRVIETAEHISAETGVKLVKMDAFNELAMGPWEGLSEEEVAKQFPEDWRIWNTTPSALVLQCRETLAQLQKRAIAGLAEVITRSPGAQNICVVSHVAVIRVIQLFAEQRALDEYKRLLVPNATPIILDINENKLS